MKKVSWLKIPAVLLAVGLPATCALAELEGSFAGPAPTHAPPTVQIVSPLEGEAFLLGDNITICADVDNFTNPVVQVQFFAGTNSLGVATNSLRHSDVFCLTVSNLVAGNYSLTAVATDSDGNTATSAAVDISVVTNFPPRVRLVAPPDGAVILGPTNIEIAASAYDPDGTVASVQFFAGTNSLGVVPTPPPVVVSNWFGVFTIKEPYSLTWSNAPAGAYVLTAVATDNAGVTATSAPVSITVVTALPPVIHIEIPADGASYFAPANIYLSAAASAPGGSVSSVQFFADGASLGVATSSTLFTNSSHVAGLYSLTWSNAPAGTYSLTAVATDTAGLSSTSAPVNIKVVPPPPPAVIITEPLSGEIFRNAPVNIALCAWERYFTNPIVRVQFFAGTNAVAATTNSPYSCVAWTNVPAGAYTLTAVATDSHSLTVTSTPVSITVTAKRTPK